MLKCVNYLIIPEYKLTLECCYGKVKVDDAIRMKQNQFLDNFYNPNYNIITDFRKLTSIIKRTTFKSINNFIKFLEKSGVQNNIALLAKSPEQVVVATILKQLCLKRLSIEVGVFTTLEAALKFVNVDPDKLPLIERELFKLDHLS